MGRTPTMGAACIALAVLAGQPAATAGQDYEPAARIWLDRGDEPVLRQGERVRLYYRTDFDAWVAIFQIDTDGTVRMVFPRSPGENHYARGGRDYRLMFPTSGWWFVDDEPGMGYYFIVASPEPFDFGDFRYAAYQGAWDLAGVGRAVYGDPYAAMDDYVARLVPDWEYVPYALDFVGYHVEERYEYPRFLCYDCHGFRPYAAWDPYLYTCTTFRVVIYDDPYYYPAARYRGDRVVFVRPARPGLPRFSFKERARGESARPLVTARPALGSDPLASPRRSTAGIGSGGTRGGASGSVQARPGLPVRARPDASVGRPSDVLPGRRPAGARPAPGSPGSTGRPVLQRRPPGGGGGDGRPPVARPSTRPPTAGPARGGDERRPAVRPGGTPRDPVSTARPPVRRPSGGSARAPVRRPSGGSARPPVRKPSGGSARPPVRKPGGGSAGPVRKPSGGAARPPVRKPGGGSARPPVRRPGGGSSPLGR